MCESKIAHNNNIEIYKFLFAQQNERMSEGNTVQRIGNVGDGYGEYKEQNIFL